MSAIKKSGGQSTATRKEIRKRIIQQMEDALPELQELLGEEKFHVRLKKAAKLLTRDFAGEPAVADGETEKPVRQEETPVKLKKAPGKTAAKKAIKKAAAKKTGENRTSAPKKAAKPKSTPAAPKSK